MSGFTLLVPGDPVPKGRPRVYRGHGVTPSRTRIAESRVRADFMAKYPDRVTLTGPVEVYAEFWKAKRGRPDLDNLVKLVTDALNGIAYVDDERIKTLQAVQYEPDRIVKGKRPGTWRKRRPGDPYTRHGVPYEPHTYIRITPLPEWDPKASTPTSSSTQVKEKTS